jgi:hypothetical protein
MSASRQKAVIRTFANAVIEQEVPATIAKQIISMLRAGIEAK